MNTDVGRRPSWGLWRFFVGPHTFERGAKLGRLRRYLALYPIMALQALVAPGESVTEAYFGDCPTGLQSTPNPANWWYGHASSFSSPTAAGILAKRIDAPIGDFLFTSACIILEVGEDYDFVGSIVVLADDNGKPGEALLELPFRLPGDYQTFGEPCSPGFKQFEVPIFDYNGFPVSAPFFVGVRYDSVTFATCKLGYKAEAGQTTFETLDGATTWTTIPDRSPSIHVSGISTECSDGYVADDGSFESYLATDSVYSGYVTEIIVPDERMAASSVCLYARAQQAGLFSGTLGLYDGDGMLLGKNEFSISLTADQSGWFNVRLRDAVTNLESVIYLLTERAYLQVSWDSSVGSTSNEFIGVDLSPETDRQVLLGVRRTDGTPEPLETTRPDIKALGVRLNFRPVSYGGAFVECQDNLVKDGMLEGSRDSGSWNTDLYVSIWGYKPEFDERGACFSGSPDEYFRSEISQELWLPPHSAALLSFDVSMQTGFTTVGESCLIPTYAGLDVYFDGALVFSEDNSNSEFKAHRRRVVLPIVSGESRHLLQFEGTSSGPNVCIDNICLSTPGVSLGGLCQAGSDAGDTCRLTSDLDGSGTIQLGELLRIIQFYNAGGLQCAEHVYASEDGYLAGAGNLHDCVPHKSDYAPQDWAISLSELLRAVQFYNVGGYVYCPDAATEDGYCPVLK